jgi:hypothetical protein
VAQNWSKFSSSFLPEISVLGNNIEIVDGDATPQTVDLTDFGNVVSGESSGPHAFTIRSSGSGSLHLTGVPRILVGGPNSSDFVITVQPSATVFSNQTTTFEVVFSPSGAGSKTAEIFILNDDSNESLYNLVVQGSGTPANLSPTGDYNANGAVDAADYVMWRKTEGLSVAPFSASDGSGNGMVDQADYDIWRANFGDTMPPPGSGGAATLTVTAAKPVPPKATTEAVASEQGTTATEMTGTRKPISPLASSVVQAGTPRSGRSRLLRSSLPFVATSHDRALVAWLATRRERPQHDESADFADFPSDQISGDALGQLDNALGVVFASLGE